MNNLVFLRGYEKFNLIQNLNEASMTFNMIDGIQEPKTAQNIIGGVTCKVLDNTWSLTIRRESVVVTCNEYTRWNNISLIFYEYISELSKLLKDSQTISKIMLEYLDEFEILDIESSWKDILFKKDSKYITTNINNLNEFWHINQGYFISLDNLSGKLLDNINLNYFADDLDEFKSKINLRIQHTLIDDSYNYEISDLKYKFNAIHKHSKKIFKEIINEKILKNFSIMGFQH